MKNTKQSYTSYRKNQLINRISGILAVFLIILVLVQLLHWNEVPFMLSEIVLFCVLLFVISAPFNEALKISKKTRLGLDEALEITYEYGTILQEAFIGKARPLTAEMLHLRLIQERAYRQKLVEMHEPMVLAKKHEVERNKFLNELKQEQENNK